MQRYDSFAFWKQKDQIAAVSATAPAASKVASPRLARPSIFSAEFWGKDSDKNKHQHLPPLEDDEHKAPASPTSLPKSQSLPKERAGKVENTPIVYSPQELARAIIFLKEQLEYEVASREQAERDKKAMEERVEKMELEMKAMKENMNVTIRDILAEELSIREHDPNKSWPISYKHLHTVIHEEIKKSEIGMRRRSLKLEDDLAAELLPQLVSEEVRLLEVELKKSHDAQIALIDSTLADVKRKIEELNTQNYAFLADIASIKAHPKIRPKKDKKKKEKKGSNKDSTKSGASSDGHSRDSGRDLESIGEDDEIAASAPTAPEEKRKSKKGLKLAVLLSGGSKEKEPKKEKVHAYATIRGKSTTVSIPVSSQDVFDETPVLHQSNSSPNLLHPSTPDTPEGPDATQAPASPRIIVPSTPTAPVTPTGNTTVTTPLSSPLSPSSLGASSGNAFLSALYGDSPSKAAETRAKLVKDTFSELYGGNYQTLREWQMQKLRGGRTPTDKEGDAPRIRQFATIRYHPRRFSEEDCGKLEESLFNSEIITELSVKFVNTTTTFLKRCCIFDSSLIKGLFSYTPEEYESKILELKTKLEIQPNYDFTAQYDDPKAVASLLLLFLKNLPKPVLDKQAQPFLVSAEIENVMYRQSVLRSLYYTLPTLNQNILLCMVQLAYSLVYNVDEELPAINALNSSATITTTSELTDSTDSVPDDVPVVSTKMGTLTRSNAHKLASNIPVPPPIPEENEPTSIKGKKSKSSTNIDSTSSKKKKTNKSHNSAPPLSDNPPAPVHVYIATPTSTPSSTPSTTPINTPTKAANGTPSKPTLQTAKSTPNPNANRPLPSPTSLRNLTTSLSFSSTERGKRHTKSFSTNAIDSLTPPMAPPTTPTTATSPTPSLTSPTPATTVTRSQPAANVTPSPVPTPALTTPPPNSPSSSPTPISPQQSKHSLARSLPNSPVTQPKLHTSPSAPDVPSEIPSMTLNGTDALAAYTTPGGEPEFNPERLAVFNVAFAPILSLNKTADPESVHLFNVFVHDYNAIFMQDVKEIEFVIRNGLTIVKAASLDRLVEKLMDPYYKDPEFSDIMFLCYNYFMEASTLLDILVGYYNTTTAPTVKPWQSQLAVRVLVIIKMWIMRHSDSLQENQPFMGKLHTFIESVPNRPQEASFFKFFKTFHQQASPAPVVLKRGLSFAPHILGDRDPPPSPYGLHKKDGNITPMVDLGAVECSTMAIQLTLVDHELLRAIKPTEFLHKNFTRLASSPNFNNMVNKFNEWGMWVCSVVLAHEKVNERVPIIAYFIELAKCCVEINNFNAGCALIGGLNHSSISRLKSSWEKVPSKSMQDYEKLLHLFDMSHNYKNYREALKACKPPAIPYLGLFPKDLTAVEEGNDNRTPEGLINFEKFRLLAKQVKKIEAFQHPLFSAKIIPKINAYLKNLKLFTEKELYEKSLLYEPRKV